MSNSVTICGTSTRDCELRFTASGRATGTFGVAVNRRWQNKQTNEWEESVSFFNVVTWGDMAENCASSISKGTRVVVSGRLEQRSWETQDGEKRSVVEIVADEVGLSLRWATGHLSKTTREGGYVPAEQNEREARTRLSARETSNQGLAYQYDDDEPF